MATWSFWETLMIQKVCGECRGSLSMFSFAFGGWEKENNGFMGTLFQVLSRHWSIEHSFPP